MDRETILRLAREAGAEFAELPMTDAIVFSVEDRAWNSAALHRFAALVAAEKDKEIKMLAKALKAEQKKNKELISVMSDSVETAVRSAAKAERKRILEMCKEGWWDGEGIRYHLEKQDAIRSRT